MTNEELKDALLDKCPVVWHCIRSEKDFLASRVTKIIYWEKKGKIKVSAEIQFAKCPHSVAQVDPKFLRFADVEECREFAESGLNHSSTASGPPSLTREGK